MKKLLALLAGAIVAHSAAMAAEITVLSGGAIEPGLHTASHAFEKQTGHQVKIIFNTAPMIAKRIAAGDAFDVVIAPPAAMENYAKDGKVSAERVNVGRVGSGVVVRPGAPVPDISNAEAIRRAVLDADSLVFNRASTGIYFENLLKKMGVYGEVEKKTTRYPDGASVMEHVLKGRGKEIGFGAITEILLFREKGLRYVGPLPPEIQNYTNYAAAPMTSSRNAELARTFVQFLGTTGKPMFVAAGIE